MKEVTFSPRRIVGAALIALCIMLAAPQAGLADTNFRVWGDMDIAFNWLDNPNFDRNNKKDHFFTNQRLRILMSARVSETLQGVAMFRFLPARWGQSDLPNGQKAGFALDGDQTILRNRFLYLDWRLLSIPLTVRMGLQPLSLPFEAFRNGILESSAGGVTLTYRFNDNITATTFWARPYDNYENDTEATGNSLVGDNKLDEMDMFYFALPMTFQNPGLKLTPWAMYTHIGRDSGYWGAKTGPFFQSPKTPESNGNAWWAGISTNLSAFDPLGIKLDAVYGKLKTDDEDGLLGKPGTPMASNFNTKGWNASLLIDYKMSWGVPGLFGWYASGSDYDDVVNKQQWGYVPYVSTFGEGFNATSFGFAGHYGINQASEISWTQTGHWGIGAQIDKISIWPDLTHCVRVAYYQGTNDPDLVKVQGKPFDFNGVPARPGTPQMLTTKDQALEVNFNHIYKVYENFQIMWNTGYIHLDRGDNWDERYRDNKNAWQFSTNFKYNF